jgi:formylglycine-generating enzyme required for sulfatase activity
MKERKFALLIGNTQFNDPLLKKLKAPSADVKAFESVLNDSAIGDFDEVTLLLDRSWSELKTAIASFFTNKESEDLLLLYFSTHGVIDNQGCLYLAATNTEVNLPSGSAVDTSFIVERMDDSISKRQILILDSCFSGAYTRGTKGSIEGVGEKAIVEGTFESKEASFDENRIVNNGSGRIVLTASNATQYALESNQVHGKAEESLFTRYLIEGLKTGMADTNADGLISIEDLYNYAYRKVITTSQSQQWPQKWVYKKVGPELIIAKNPNPKAIPSSTRTIQPDTLLVESPISLELVRIPVGTFTMGTREEEVKYKNHYEYPQHMVNLSEFYIGKYPITNAQYLVFVKSTNYPYPNHWQDGQIPIGAENHPVVFVTWDDATAFCDWLSKESGTFFRLPTEAEWEKAARGTDARIYPWGNVWNPVLGISDNPHDYNDETVGAQFRRGTMPVGSFSPATDSPYGVADMLGNVWQWCLDRFSQDEYSWRIVEVKDPTGPEEGYFDRRVMRGCSFYHIPCGWASCAYRGRYSQGEKGHHGGFRIVMARKVPNLAKPPLSIPTERKRGMTWQETFMIIHAFLSFPSWIGMITFILGLIFSSFIIFWWITLIGGIFGMLAYGWAIQEKPLMQFSIFRIHSFVFGLISLVMVYLSCIKFGWMPPLPFFK